MKRGETEKKGRERSNGKEGRTEGRERRETEVRQTRRKTQGQGGRNKDSDRE
jgi:hypothetical protein